MRADDPAHDFVLHRQQVAGIAIEFLRPHVVARQIEEDGDQEPDRRHLRLRLTETGHELQRALLVEEAEKMAAARAEEAETSAQARIGGARAVGLDRLWFGGALGCAF